MTKPRYKHVFIECTSCLHVWVDAYGVSDDAEPGDECPSCGQWVTLSKSRKRKKYEEDDNGDE